MDFDDIEFEEDMDDEIEDLDEAFDELGDSIEEAEEQIDSLMDAMNEAIRIQNMLKASVDKTSNAIEDLGDTIEDIDDSLENIADTAEDLEDAFDELDDVLEDYVDTAEDAVDTTEDLNDELEELVDTTEDAEDAFEGLDDELEDYVDNTSKAAKTTDDLNKKVKETSESVKATDKELEKSLAILDRLVKLADKLDNKNIKISTDTSETRDKTDRNNRINLIDNAKSIQNQLDSQQKKMLDSMQKTIADLFIKLPSNASFGDIFKTAAKDIIDLANQMKKYNDLVNKVNSTTSKSVSLNNKNKGKNTISKDLANLGSTTSKVSKSTALTSTQMLKLISTASKAATAIGLVVTTLIAMEKAGKSAHDTTLTVEQALRKMDGSLGTVGVNAVNASNNFTIAKNRMADFGDAIASLFEPLYNGLGQLAYWLTKLIDVSREYGEGTTELSNKLSKYAEAFNKAGLEIPVKQSVPIMQSIAGGAQQSGLSMESSMNAAAGTYNAAINIAKQYGIEDVDTIAKQLSDAWLKGSDAAKDYGIVVNDEVLAGWAAQEKNLDIVNVKISDAKMQALRYELAMYQAGKTGSSAVQDQIKAWKQYGMQLKATQNQLLSFEQVVTLQGLDTEIPDIDAPDIDLSDIENTIDTEGPIVLPFVPEISGGPTVDPVTVPVELAVPATVDIAVGVPSLVPLQQLLELLNDITKEWEIPQIIIGEPLPIPVLAEILKLLEALTVGAAFSVVMTLVGITAPIVTMLGTLASIGTWLVAHPEIVTSIKLKGAEVVDSMITKIKELYNWLSQIDMESALNTVGNGIWDSFKSITGLADIGKGANTLLQGAGAVGNWLETSGANDFARDVNERFFGKETGWKTGLSAIGGGLLIAGGGIAGTLAGAGAGATATSGAVTTGSNIIDISHLFVNSSAAAFLPAAANGGISTKSNIIRISENNSTEAILPLNNPSANPAFDSIAEGISSRLIGPGGGTSSTNNTYNLAPGGVVIADNYSVDKFVELIANKLATMQRDRGELNYGTR